MGRKTPISFNYKNMLKSMQRAVVSGQQNKKTRRATTQTTLFLI